MDTHSLSPGRFARRLTLAAVAAGALVWGVLADEKPAAAQVVWVAPPVVRVESVPYPAPPESFWVGGYWGWNHGRHVWYEGRWVHERPGWAYERPRWGREGRGWRFSPGRWHRR
jgi:hypothetical protein